MVQAMCLAADMLLDMGVQGVWGWLLVWLSYVGFGYVFFTSFLVLWFVYFFVFPTYDKWRFKTNPAYPSPTTVLGEIVLGVLVGIPTVTFMPSIHLWLIANGTLRHHCATPLTWQYRAYSCVLVLCVVDVYEWCWHYAGHRVGALWAVHRHHHNFANPTPFGTIADYPADNVMRSSYMVVVNLASYSLVGLPADIDVVYVVTAIAIGFYGMYLHCGHELAFLPHDNPVFNTSYQHCTHHALSYRNRPYYTGFVFKAWDNLADARYHGTQFIPAVEDQKLGNRSLERWEKNVKPNLPDYGVLLTPRFWMLNWKPAVGLVRTVATNSVSKGD